MGQYLSPCTLGPKPVKIIAAVDFLVSQKVQHGRGLVSICLPDWRLRGQLSECLGLQTAAADVHREPGLALP